MYGTLPLFFRSLHCDTDTFNNYIIEYSSNNLFTFLQNYIAIFKLYWNKSISQYIHNIYIYIYMRVCFNCFIIISG